MNIPKNIEAEKALLSSLFLDPGKFITVSEIVNGECFYVTMHQDIFGAIERLHAAGGSIEVLTIHEELQRQKKDIPLYEIQGIADYYPTAEIAERHAEIVKEKHTRRAAIIAMHQAIEATQDESKNIQDVISTVQKQLDDSLPSDTRRKVSCVYPEIAAVVERIVDMPKGGYGRYIETGFLDLDNAVLLSNGTLTIIGAVPRAGKTSFVLCVMRNMERQGKRPLLFTLEMTRARILENIIAQEMQFSHQHMIKGWLSDEQRSAMLNAVVKWSQSRIGVLDGRWSATQIRHRAIKEKREAGVDIIFVDALGKMPPPEGCARDKRHEVYEANTELLDNVAIELDIPVVLTHHLNREGAKGKPSLFHLNEAGEKFADNVILMYREYLVKPTRENKNEAEFIIAKSRDGDVDSVNLGWNGPTKTFFNLARQHQEEVNRYWDQ